MGSDMSAHKPRILILASQSGGYAGADSVGQIHANYPSNTYIFPVLSPCMFPEEFYLQAFERGVDGIIVMFSGTDSPYKGDSERTAAIVNRVYTKMKERGMDTRRLRLVAICTVCTAPFLREVNQMNELLQEIGPIGDEVAAAAAQEIAA
jgi:F420-non-reducing hydrogenase iron-sulfur subunit